MATESTADTHLGRYDPSQIEARWRQRWEAWGFVHQPELTAEARKHAVVRDVQLGFTTLHNNWTTLGNFPLSHGQTTATSRELRSSEHRARRATDRSAVANPQHIFATVHIYTTSQRSS